MVEDRCVSTPTRRHIVPYYFHRDRDWFNQRRKGRQTMVLLWGSGWIRILAPTTTPPLLLYMMQGCVPTHGCRFSFSFGLTVGKKKRKKGRVRLLFSFLFVHVCLFWMLLLFISSCSSKRPIEKSKGERVLDSIYFPRTQTASNIENKQQTKINSGGKVTG